MGGILAFEGRYSFLLVHSETGPMPPGMEITPDQPCRKGPRSARGGTIRLASGFTGVCRGAVGSNQHFSLENFKGRCFNAPEDFKLIPGRLGGHLAAGQSKRGLTRRNNSLPRRSCKCTQTAGDRADQEDARYAGRDWWQGAVSRHFGGTWRGRKNAKAICLMIQMRDTKLPDKGMVEEICSPFGIQQGQVNSFVGLCGAKAGPKGILIGSVR